MSSNRQKLSSKRLRERSNLEKKRSISCVLQNLSGFTLRQVTSAVPSESGHISDSPDLVQVTRSGRVGNGEWGVGNGEWGISSSPPFPVPHSPLPLSSSRRLLLETVGA